MDLARWKQDCRASVSQISIDAASRSYTDMDARARFASRRNSAFEARLLLMRVGKRYWSREKIVGGCRKPSPRCDSFAVSCVRIVKRRKDASRLCRYRPSLSNRSNRWGQPWQQQAFRNKRSCANVADRLSTPRSKLRVERYPGLHRTPQEAPDQFNRNESG